MADPSVEARPVCPGCGRVLPKRHRVGMVEAALVRDLETLRVDERGLSTLGAMARTLARQIDARGGDGPTTTAKLMGELRVMMGAVAKGFEGGEGGGDDGASSGQLPAPAVPAVVRDSAQS